MAAKHRSHMSGPTRNNNFHKILKLENIIIDVVTANIKKRLEQAESVPLTWDPVKGGKPGPVRFEDEKQVDLGPDPDGRSFEEIADRMTTGRYYPPDAVEFFGRFQQEGRPLVVGERIVQRAPIGPFKTWSAVELFVVKRTKQACSIGYVTTARHHGRGIWRADLTLEGGRLKLRVKSTALPQSWLCWLGLPVARYLQLRARRRSIQEFQKLATKLMH